MSEHRYTTSERREQLRELERALGDLLNALRETGRLLEHAPRLEDALSRTRELLDAGFDQDALSALSRSVPKLFYLHKEWTPPMEIGPDGRPMVPHWFAALEPLDQAVADRAFRLRVLGSY